MPNDWKNWALLSLITMLLTAEMNAGELNLWPFLVRQTESESGRPDHWGSLGPFFSVTEREEARIASFRPFWTAFDYRLREESSDHILYPFVNWTEAGEVHYGHVLNLLQYRYDKRRDDRLLQLFPFVFYRSAPRPENSYFAIWPFGGVLKNRLWRDRITFAAWPLFVRTVKGDEVRTHLPYPFVQLLEGPRSSGFGLWPLYGRFQRDNDYDHTWALWPVLYHFKDQLDEETPYVRFGMLPFYHRETGAGLESETWLWPFFGYTKESPPRVPYSEVRYFWPFLVQGNGEERYVNRWLPIYAHEQSPGYEKQWYLWPLLKRETFEEGPVTRDRASFFYFLYRDEQQDLGDAVARLTFVWPLLGYWNNGQGRKQFQMLDPLSVFFPRNEKIRENWTPLFSLYRFDERDGNQRHSLLWDLLVWETDSDGLNAFYAGPVFEWVRGHHWEIFKGLFGSRDEGEGWSPKVFWQK